MRCDIYLDESSQTAHRYLLLGGVIIPTAEVVTFDASAVEARGDDLPAGELGWVKVSRTKLAAYRRFVEAFFQNGGLSFLHFHCIAVDTHKLDDRHFNAGSREAGFNKEIYQLVMKFGRLYRAHEFDVYLDERSTSTRLDDLRLIMNRGLAKINPGADWPVRRLHFRRSATCHALQAVDVLLGAVAFHLNGHRTREGASAAKCDLSDHILDLAGITNVRRDTAVSGRFTVWHRQLRQPQR